MKRILFLILILAASISAQVNMRGGGGQSLFSTSNDTITIKSKYNVMSLSGKNLVVGSIRADSIDVRITVIEVDSSDCVKSDSLNVNDLFTVSALGKLKAAGITSPIGITTPSEGVFSSLKTTGYLICPVNSLIYAKPGGRTSGGISFSSAVSGGLYIQTGALEIDYFNNVFLDIVPRAGKDAEFRYGNTGTAGEYSRTDSLGIYYGPSDAVKIKGTGVETTNLDASATVTADSAHIGPAGSSYMEFTGTKATVYVDAPVADSKAFTIGTSADVDRFSVDEDGDVNADGRLALGDSLQVGAGDFIRKTFISADGLSLGFIYYNPVLARADTAYAVQP